MCWSFVLLLIFFFIPVDVWGLPEVIVIRAEKTVVYADQHRKIPLATLSRGKILRVAENSVQVDSLYPITVSGKLAYIPVEDIYDPHEVKEQWFRRYYISPNLSEAYLYRRWVREHYLSFSTGAAFIGNDLPGLAISQGGGTGPGNQFSLPLTVTGSWRTGEDFGWSVGGEYSYWSEGQWNYQRVLGLAALDLFLWDAHRTSLVWSSGGLFSPYGVLNYTHPEGTRDSSAWAWGAQTQLRWHWRWDRLWGVFFDGAYRYLRLQGLGDDFPGRGKIEEQGFQLRAGIFFAWD